MPDALTASLRARGLVPPDYDGRGLLNIPSTVLDVLDVRQPTDPPVLVDLDPALRDGARRVVTVLVDGLGWAQLNALCDQGVLPFLAEVRDRARARDGAQLLEATTVFPSTTAAAITTMNTARTPLEHGNIAYFAWVEEFAQVTQMLRWGAAVTRRGSYFDDATVDPRRYVQVPSIHGRLRENGIPSFVVEPEMFRTEAMTRMHAAEASYLGYILPSTMGVRIREFLASPPGPGYLYAYWSGVDTACHIYGPYSAEAAAEAALVDLDLRRAVGDRARGDTLLLLTADHGHAAIDPDRTIDLIGDEDLAALLRNPLSGEPRLVFIHTDHPDLVREHLEQRWPRTFTVFDRDELIAAGLFGRGEGAVTRGRIGELVAMLTGERSASLVRVDGQVVRHRGDHGGMTADEMKIPILAWRV
jgi:Type I phosphodiesterase / nucleotide pyrophosphatase